MTCNNCGSLTSCNPINNCNCQCGSNPCSCGGQPSIATPSPFYNCAGAVQENHCQTILQQQFVTAIQTGGAFNMPATEQTAMFTIPGLQKIQIGSYLWNDTYGYLEVMSFDYVNSLVVVKNHNNSGNAASGTLIPACVLFNVVDPPGSGSSAGGQTGIFLAADFVAPAVGSCVDIQVTGIVGVTAGAQIQVSSGIYQVSAIVTPTVITICNNGSGVVHGVTVVAKDSQGVYIVPVTPLNTSPCQNASTTIGALVVCRNGVESTLKAASVGQVPVVSNATTNEVSYQTLNIPAETCTALAADITLLNGTTSYVIHVTSNTAFSLNQLVVIHFGTYSTARWTVTNIDGGGLLMTINKTTPQVGNDTIPSGNNVCIASCCEQIQLNLGTTNSNVSTVTTNFNNHISSLVFSAWNPATVTATAGVGGGSISNLSISAGRYFHIGNLVIAQVAFTCTVTGNVTSVKFPLPFSAANGGHDICIGTATMIYNSAMADATIRMLTGDAASGVINNVGGSLYTGANTINVLIIYETA